MSKVTKALLELAIRDLEYIIKNPPITVRWSGKKFVDIEGAAELQSQRVAKARERVERYERQLREESNSSRLQQEAPRG